MSIDAIPPLPDPETLRTGWVSIPVAAAPGVAATTIRSWWSRPASGPLRGGVLVLPEVFGINGWVRSVADRLAAQGYGALAITPFSRTAPALDLGYDAVGLATGREHRDQVEAVSFRADAQAAVHWLQQRLHAEGLSGDRPLGCVGFCFGGHLALLAATLQGIGATCSFYGARISTDRPGGGPPTLAVLPEIPGRLWCFLGDADPLIPAAEVAAIRFAMTMANGGIPPENPGAHHRLWCAPQAGHGYLCEVRADFKADQASIAWDAMLELFEERVGGL